MNAQVPARPGPEGTSRPVAETEGWSAPGVRVLVIGIVVLLAAIGLLALGVALGPGSEQATQQVVNTGSLYQ